MTNNFIRAMIRDKLDALADFTSEALRSAAVDDMETARVLEREGGRVVEDIGKLNEMHEDGER